MLCDVYRNCVKTILEHRDWKKAMRTTHPGYDLHGDVVPETPMRLLIKIYPDLAEVVFDNCVIKLKQKEKVTDPFSSPKNIVLMNYEFIDDAYYIKSNPEDKGFSFFSLNNY